MIDRNQPDWKIAGLLLWPWAICGVFLGTLVGYFVSDTIQSLINFPFVMALIYATSYIVVKIVRRIERR